MPKSYPSSIKEKAVTLRKKGYSYNEISNELDIAKSTTYNWTQNTKLHPKVRNILNKKTENTRKNLRLAVKAKKKQRKKLIDEIKKDSTKVVNNVHFSKNVNRLLCSILYWAEGNKDNTTVRFTNSDPKMVKSFLFLLKAGFDIEAPKLKALVHIHEYHKEDEIKHFWSKITRISLNQFYKSYRKPNSSKRVKDGYKGCITIYYHDYKIALKLKHIYNAYAEIT